ncbi:LOW QUALITY PROTEIN: hypothetical protein HID58_072688, partial [Brassica napus]
HFITELGSCLFFCRRHAVNGLRYFVEDKKKGREGAQGEEAVKKYNSEYAFSFENMRNIKFKEFRQQYRHNGRLKQSDAGCLGHSASDEIRHAIFRASSCFMVMLDFLLQICQMKRLKRLAFPDTTSGTHFYFDNECLTGQSFLQLYLDLMMSFTSSKYGDVQKIETVTLAELNNYVLNSPPQSGGPNSTSSSNFCSQESSDAQEDPLHLRDPTQEFMSYKQRLRSH